MGLGWGLQPGQLLPQAGSPFRQLQHQGGRIGLQQGRWIKGGPPLLFRGAPQPHSPPGAQTAGPARPLLGAGLAGGQGHQLLHAGGRVKAAAAAEARVDHQGDPCNRERTFGDGCSQHQLPRRVGRGLNRPALGRQGQIAVQGAELQLPAPAAGGDRLLALLNLPLPRQKHQHGFRRRALIQPVAFQGPHHLGRQAFPLPGRLMADGHRMAAAFAGEQGGLRQLLLQGLQVEGGGHQQQPQLRRQHRSRFPQQGQGQVGVAAPLVEFVEDHAAHPRQAGVGLELPQKQPIGEQLDAGGRRDPALQPHAVAHALAHRFPEAGGQALRRRLGRQPPRLQHQDAAVVRPLGIGEGLLQGQGHPRGFARTRGGLQQHGGTGPQPLHQLRQQRINRQRRCGCRQALVQRTWRAPSTGWYTSPVFSS